MRVWGEGGGIPEPSQGGYLDTHGAPHDLTSAAHIGPLAKAGVYSNRLARLRCQGLGGHVDGHWGSPHHARPGLARATGLLADDAHAAVPVTLQVEELDVNTPTRTAVSKIVCQA